MDNRALANILYETADLLEVANEDPFRIRSYRRAAEALEAHSQQVAPFICDNNDKAVLAIPGIGKGMLANLKELCANGKLQLHEDLLTKYQPAMLDLLKISGLGPKTIALIWDTYHVCDPAGVKALAEQGKIRTLPRMGEKAEQKILKGIASFLSSTGRFHLDEADMVAQRLIAHLTGTPGVEKITPAGSLRRGRETVGDLDVLVTGNGCEPDSLKLEAIKDKVLAFPGILDVLVRGDNKVSFKLRSGMQVDVRLLPPASFGAAMQYFTGSKNHNVTLRQRALKMGFTLNEYGLFKLEPGQKAPEDESDKPVKPVAGKLVAGRTEEDVYKKLGLPYIPPEMRENCGEIEVGAEGKLPELITQDDIQGDVHMHTVATDGKNTIEEMARAAKEHGYKYMAITDHSKNLAFANGLDDARALEHIKKIRAVTVPGIKIFAGIEVDILADGELDLSDSVLAEMDVVIASIHSNFQQEPAKITDRLLRVLDNKYVSILGHPTGRMLLRREGYKFDMDAILAAAAKNKVAMEHNAYPDRLDLNDVHLRMARERGVKVVINTDAHHTSHMEKIKYGILQARRAWLTKADVLNTLPTAAFAKAMKRA